MKLIPNWRQWWRMWTVWFQGAAAIFFTYITAVPDATFQIWSVLPADIRSAIDPDYVQYAGIALIILGIIARVLKQPKLADKAGDATSP